MTTMTTRPAGSVWLYGKKGPIWVNPATVAAVESTHGGGTVVHLVGGQTLHLSDERTAAEIAVELLGDDGIDR